MTSQTIILNIDPLNFTKYHEQIRHQDGHSSIVFAPPEPEMSDYERLRGLLRTNPHGWRILISEEVNAVDGAFFHILKILHSADEDLPIAFSDSALPLGDHMKDFHVIETETDIPLSVIAIPERWENDFFEFIETEADPDLESDILIEIFARTTQRRVLRISPPLFWTGQNKSQIDPNFDYQAVDWTTEMRVRQRNFREVGDDRIYL